MMRGMRARFVWIWVSLLALGCSELPASPDAGLDGCVLDPSSCAPPVDACDPNPCTMPNRSRCVAEGGAAMCLCDGGHHEEDGACVPDTTCTDTTCSGHGTCAMSGVEPVCTCDAGYTGAFCDACAEGWFPDGAGGCDDDPCDPSPCTDGGRTRCVAEGGVAMCLCDAGRHEEGGECVPDETCTDTTCSGRGTCSSEGGGVACACDEGFDGAFCERCADGYHDDGAGGCTTDVCLPSPCTEPNRSVCVPDGAAARCECDPGFHLEGESCVADEVCSDTSCGHGSCAIDGGRVVCTCDPGWAGPTCASCAEGYHDDGAGGCTTDVCLPNPCTGAGAIRLRRERRRRALRVRSRLARGRDGRLHRRPVRARPVRGERPGVPRRWGNGRVLRPGMQRR